MSDEQGIQEIDLNENPPVAYAIPGEQTLCTLIRVVATPEGLITVPDIAVVAMGDQVLWYAAPGLGAFLVGLEEADALDFKFGEGGYGAGVASAPSLSAYKTDSAGDGTPAHVWHTGMSHAVGGRPTRPQQVIRYWLWQPGATPGAARTLLVSPPRIQTFEASGTVRPEEDPV
jgi:hypothetical protein